MKTTPINFLKKKLIKIIILLFLILFLYFIFGRDFYSLTGISENINDIDKITIETRYEYAGEYKEILYLENTNDIKILLDNLYDLSYIFSTLIDTDSLDPALESNIYIKFYSNKSPFVIMQLTDDSKIVIYKYTDSSQNNLLSVFSYITSEYDELYNSLIEIKKRV